MEGWRFIMVDKFTRSEKRQDKDAIQILCKELSGIRENQSGSPGRWYCFLYQRAKYNNFYSILLNFKKDIGFYDFTLVLFCDMDDGAYN
jgi:hypothetical protein